MSKVSDVIGLVRIEIGDEEYTRFKSDSTLVSLVKKAIARTSHILAKHNMALSHGVSAIPTVAGTAAYDFPADYVAPIGLYRDSNHTELTHLSLQEWEMLVSAPELTYWTQKSAKIEVNGTPTAVETLTLHYVKRVDPSAYTTTTTMPWSGQLDYIIADYVKMLLLTLDEMDIKTEMALSRELEDSLLSAFQQQTPYLVRGRGWNN